MAHQRLKGASSSHPQPSTISFERVTATSSVSLFPNGLFN
jgi:hypothetical protein